MFVQRSFESLLFLLFFLCVHFASTASAEGVKAKPADQGVGRKFFKYVTRPDIDAPIFDIRHFRDIKTQVAPGYFFVSFYGDLGQRDPGYAWVGPAIYNDRGELIWSGASAFQHWDVFDFGLSTFEGRDALTMVSNHDKKGYILDNTYQIRKEVPLLQHGETQSNMHAFNVIEGGTRALTFDRHPSLATPEAARILGANGSCVVGYQGFREWDLESPEPQLLFEWDAKNHIAVNESSFLDSDANITRLCRDGWDLFHLNSIDKFPDGDYLLSARHTNTIYKVSHVDGSIVWRLGGNMSDFRLLGNATFSRQHHATVRSQDGRHTVITLLDNAVGYGTNEFPTHEFSRGLVISLNTRSMTARIITQYPHPYKLLVNARGSFQTLPNGNVLICWSRSALMSEHSPDGKMIMQAQVSARTDTYRAFKYPWVGNPAQPPDVVSQALYNGTDIVTWVYMSWNGATELIGWRVQEVDEGGTSRELGFEWRVGFETTAAYRGFKKAIFVEALDVNNQTLGKSRSVHTIEPRKIGEESSIWRTGEADEPEQPPQSKPDVPSSSNEQLHPDLPSDPNTKGIESWHPEHPLPSPATKSSVISLDVFIALAGVGTIVGLVLGLLIPRISSSWVFNIGRRKDSHFKYRTLEMDDEGGEHGQVEELEKG